VNEGGDTGRQVRRAQLAALTGGKDCLFVDAGTHLQHFIVHLIFWG